MKTNDSKSIMSSLTPKRRQQKSDPVAVTRLAAATPPDDHIGGEDGAESDVAIAAKPKLRFQVASDLHLEMLPRGADFSSKLPPALTSLMVLAGDIYVGRADDFLDVLSRVASRYPRVLYVAGNHEYYGSRREVYSMREVREYVAACCRRIHNVDFLDDSSVTVDGVEFVGGTMWTNVPPSEFPVANLKMADFSVIGVDRDAQPAASGVGDVRSLSPEDVVEMHAATKRYFEERIRAAEATGTEVVAVTHHAPSARHVGAWTRGDTYRSFYFSTDLDRLLRAPPVAAWVHGHTHCSNNQTTEGGARLVANPRGYDAPDFAELNPLYKPDLVVSLYDGGAVRVNEGTVR